MLARDLIMAGHCSPMCLLALVPDSTCHCSCGGEFHGAASDAVVPEPIGRPRVSDERARELVIQTMSVREKSRYVESRGWRRLGSHWIRSDHHRMATLGAALRIEMDRDMAVARIDGA